MIRFHKEGFNTILITVVTLLALNITVTYFCIKWPLVIAFVAITSLVFLYIILQFFRNPKRNQTFDENFAIAPADGKVVIIEEIEEPEYFKDKRLQVSIFMSPFNVHVNRYPFSGLVTFFKYHPGLFLVAWHPKSSTKNERTTVVIKHNNGKEVLVRQIAGAVARRIVWYCKEGDKASQNSEFGFIKFGSRVDLFFPIGTNVCVKVDEVVKGGITKIAEM